LQLASARRMRAAGYAGPGRPAPGSPAVQGAPRIRPGNGDL